jgi:hypothetical protein
MRIIRNLLASLVVLASIVFGALAAVKNPPELFNMPENLTLLADQGLALVGGANNVFFSCVGLSLTALVTVFLSFVGGKKHRDIRVELEGGSVVMSESAIRSYLDEAMKEFPQIGVRRIDIYSGGRGLMVQMQADLKTQQHVPDLEQSIITRIHVALVKELGISKVQQVQVSVSGFRPTAGGSAHGRAPDAKAFPAPPTAPAVVPVAASPMKETKPVSAPGVTPEIGKPEDK